MIAGTGFTVSSSPHHSCVGFYALLVVDARLEHCNRKGVKKASPEVTPQHVVEENGIRRKFSAAA
jgi:hypothetical protein